MRINSGEWKGHRLKTVKGMMTRPTSDKVKGAMFSILGNKVAEARVLDLFAGTGNLSMEALSRGAEQAVLVEKSNLACEAIQDNIKKLKAEERSKLCQMDVFTFLKQNHPEKFDLIFLDPPYHQGLAQKVLSYCRQKPILNPKGVVIVETASDEKLNEELYPYEVRIEREYGDTKLWFLQETEDQEED
jgi:16S rRNA (guanine966-N2)-methyltransferase